MRKISEMYKRSGGATPNRRCKECQSYTNRRCFLHPQGRWEENYVACKFFFEKEPEEIEGQMRIEDYE